MAVALALLGPTLASADTFEATTRSDHVPGACTPGDCTLREAVMAANTLPGDDRVKLPSRKAVQPHP